MPSAGKAQGTVTFTFDAVSANVYAALAASIVYLTD